MGYKGGFTPLQSFLDVKKFMDENKIEKCHLAIGNFQIDVVKDITPERFWSIFQSFAKRNSVAKERIIDFSEL
jgi:hypothetical protein